MSGREVVMPFAAFHTEAVPKLRATALLGRAVEGCHATVFFARGPKAKLPKLVQPPKTTCRGQNLAKRRSCWPNACRQFSLKYLMFAGFDFVPNTQWAPNCWGCESAKQQRECRRHPNGTNEE